MEQQVLGPNSYIGKKKLAEMAVGFRFILRARSRL
jgi:hypothetical protein